MKTNHCFLIAIGGLAACMAWAEAQAAPSSPPIQPPVELLSSPWVGEEKIVYRDAKEVWLTFGSMTKNVEILRKERQLPTDEWSSQKQILSVSFHPLDVRSLCDREMFVTGVNRLGVTLVEKWTITHPASIDASGAYVPLADRPLPRVDRDIIYSGTELGHIRTLANSRDGDTLFLVTHEIPRLIRMDAGTGGWTVVHTVATLPELPQIHVIYTKQHVVHGLNYVAGMDSRTHQRKLPAGVESKIVLLPDADEDGALAPPQVFDLAQWKAAGYQAPGAFLDPCP